MTGASSAWGLAWSSEVLPESLKKSYGSQAPWQATKCMLTATSSSHDSYQVVQRLSRLMLSIRILRRNAQAALMCAFRESEASKRKIFWGGRRALKCPLIESNGTVL